MIRTTKAGRRCRPLRAGAMVLALTLLAGACGTELSVELPIDVLSPLCNRVITADRAVEVSCDGVNAAAAADAASPDGCRRVVQTDEYGFQEIVEICDGVAPPAAADAPELDEDAGVDDQVEPTPIPQSETATIADPIDVSDLELRFAYDRNEAMTDFVGSVEAVDLTDWIRDRFVLLAGCADAPTGLTNSTRIDAGNNALFAIPDRDVLSALDQAIQRLTEADVLCNQGDVGAWVEVYADALEQLDTASLLVDRGLRDELSLPPVGALADDLTLLSSYAMSMYERFFWVMRGQGNRVGSDFWFVSEQLAIMRGARLFPQDSARADVAILGESVPAGAFDPFAVSQASNLTVANYSVSASGAAFVPEWTTDLHEAGILAPSLVWAMSSHDLMARCPKSTASRPQLLQPLAFQGASAFSELSPLDLMLNPEVPLNASPLRARATFEFSQWPVALGRVNPAADRIWTDEEPGNQRANFVAKYESVYETGVCPEWWELLDSLQAQWAGQGVERFAILLHPRPERLNEGHPDGAALHAAAVSQVREYTEASGIFFDDQSDQFGPEFFADFGGHYNEAGRQAFSVLLPLVLADWGWT